MRITVPDTELEHFWEEPPPDEMEFWAFRWEPKAQPGDEIFFVHERKVIAKASVHSIVPPGTLACDTTGRFRRLWKVFWLQESFVDLKSER